MAGDGLSHAAFLVAKPCFLWPTSPDSETYCSKTALSGLPPSARAHSPALTFAEGTAISESAVSFIFRNDWRTVSGSGNSQRQSSTIRENTQKNRLRCCGAPRYWAL